MKIQVTNLSNGVLSSLAAQTISISNKAVYSVVENNPLLIRVEAEYSTFNAVFGKQQSSGLGKSVEEADLNVGSAFMGIKTMLSGLIKMPKFAKQQLAIDLMTIFDQRGSEIITLSYNEQTAEIDKLIADLEKPENSTKLTELGLSMYFDALKQSQADFKSIYATQLEVNSSLRSLPSASSIRHNMEESLRNYLALVEAMKAVPGWSALHAELNELVKAIRNSNLGSRTEKPEPVEAH